MLIWIKRWNVIKHKNLLSHTKFGYITFGNTEIKKQKFHHCKNLTLLEDADIDTIQIWLLLVKKCKYFLVTKVMMMIIKLNYYA